MNQDTIDLIMAALYIFSVVAAFFAIWYLLTHSKNLDDN